MTPTPPARVRAPPSPKIFNITYDPILVNLSRSYLGSPCFKIGYDPDPFKSPGIFTPTTAMVEKAFDIIQNCEQSMPILKCIMLTYITKQIALRDALVEKALKHPRYKFDGNVLYEVSRAYSYEDPLENDKAIEILNFAKEKAITNKKHVYVDLALIKRQRGIEGKNWAEMEFATL